MLSAISYMRAVFAIFLNALFYTKKCKLFTFLVLFHLYFVVEVTSSHLRCNPNSKLSAESRSGTQVFAIQSFFSLYQIYTISFKNLQQKIMAFGIIQIKLYLCADN